MAGISFEAFRELRSQLRRHFERSVVEHVVTENMDFTEEACRDALVAMITLKYTHSVTWVHFFNASVQLTITVIGAVTPRCTGIGIRKRPSGLTSN